MNLLPLDSVLYSLGHFSSAKAWLLGHLPSILQEKEQSLILSFLFPVDTSEGFVETVKEFTSILQTIVIQSKQESPMRNILVWIAFHLELCNDRRFFSVFAYKSLMLLELWKDLETSDPEEAKKVLDDFQFCLEASNWVKAHLNIIEA